MAKLRYKNSFTPPDQVLNFDQPPDQPTSVKYGGSSPFQFSEPQVQTQPQPAASSEGSIWDRIKKPMASSAPTYNPISIENQGTYRSDIDWGQPGEFESALDRGYFGSQNGKGPGYIDEILGNYNDAGGAGQWYPDSQTIGLPDRYLVAPWTGGNQSDNWQTVMRGPEGAGGGYGDGYGMDPTGYGGALNASYLQALQGGLNQDKFNTLWDTIMGNVAGLPGQHNKNLETLIEGTNKTRNSQLSNIRAILADRGLLSEPGHTQGIESSSYTNLEDSLAQQYATGLRDLQGREFENQSDLFNTAADLLNQDNSSKIGVLNAASGHQSQLGNLTVQMLDQNRQWNQFLGQLGLDREKVMADIQSGNISQWMSLIQAFTQTLGTAAEGQA